MKKTLYFDTETTGTDPKKASIIQFAGIMEYDNEEVDRINVHFQPFEEAEIDTEALKKNGTSFDQLLEYMPHFSGFTQIQQFLDKHCNKFDRNDKIYPAGYNIKFDLDFLGQCFIYNGEKYGVGSYFNYRSIDPLFMLYILNWKGKSSLPDYKLTTVCEHYKIDMSNAHNAMCDIEATRTLIKKLFL